MRERLIELICNCPSKIMGANMFFEKISVDLADHFLANGVIVPPCKVGLTLYFLYDRRYADKPDLTTQIYETNEWYFDIDENGISIKPRFVHGYKGKYHYYLGKTVFLTEEEAKAALTCQDFRQVEKGGAE